MLGEPTPAGSAGEQNTGSGRGAPSCADARGLEPSARVLPVGPGSATRFRDRTKVRGERRIHPSPHPSSRRVGRTRQPTHRGISSPPRHRHRSRPNPRAHPAQGRRHTAQLGMNGCDRVPRILGRLPTHVLRVVPGQEFVAQHQGPTTRDDGARERSASTVAMGKANWGRWYAEKSGN